MLMIVSLFLFCNILFELMLDWLNELLNKLQGFAVPKMSPLSNVQICEANNQSLIETGIKHLMLNCRKTGEQIEGSLILRPVRYCQEDIVSLRQRTAELVLAGTIWVKQILNLKKLWHPIFQLSLLCKSILSALLQSKNSVGAVTGSD